MYIIVNRYITGIFCTGNFDIVCGRRMCEKGHGFIELNKTSKEIKVCRWCGDPLSRVRVCHCWLEATVTDV